MSDDAVYRFDEQTGEPLGPGGIFIQAGAGGLSDPSRTAVGPDGAFYVASGGNDSVLRYDLQTGAFRDAFISNGGTGTGVDRLDNPVDLIFRENLLYVGSQLNDSIKRYNAFTGQFFDTFIHSGSGGLDAPQQMAFGPDGNLYVVGRFSEAVHRYDGASGASLGTIPTGAFSQPFGLDFGPDGLLYISTRNPGSILRYDPLTGAFLGSFVPPGSGGLSAPFALEFGPGNDLYVASFGDDSVKRYQGNTGAFVGNLVVPLSTALNEPTFLSFAIPEPSSTLLVGIGAVGLSVRRRRR